MSFDEDKDEPPTSTERLLHADAKRDKLERKERAKGNLINEVKLQSLKQQVTLSPFAIDKAPRKQEAPTTEAKSNTEGQFGTKTLEQKQQEEMQTAQDKPTTDKTVTEEKRQENAQQQAEQEYQQDAG